MLTKHQRYLLRTRGIPLTGADHFHMSLEAESRQFFDASHLAQLVLRLGPGFQTDSFIDAVRRAYRQIPFLHASIRPKWGGLFGPSVYHASGSFDPVPIHVHTAENESGNRVRGVPSVVRNQLNAGPVDLRNDPLIRFDLVESGDDTMVAITWLYLLLDGHGITKFIRLLSDLGSDSSGDIPLDAEHELRSPIDLPPLVDRLRIEGTWTGKMKELSRPKPGSLAGPLRNMPKQLDYDVHRFSPETTADFDELARSEAGVISPMIFYLAISIRAHHRVFQMRATVPSQYLVPVAVDLRTEAHRAPMFRNHVSFMWFGVEPDELDGRQQLIDQLQRQKRSQIKSGFPETTAIAMENNRYLPATINRRMMRSQTGGELCSMFFAYSGDLLGGCSTICGGEILDGFPTPGVPPSPGSSFVWSYVHEQLTLTHLYQRGVVEPDERDAMLEQLQDELPGSSFI